MSGNRRLALVCPVIALLLVAAPGVAAARGGTAAPRAAAAHSDCGPIPAFNDDNFPAGQDVTNRFLPWVPGTQFVLKGTVDGEPHEVVTTVTDLTKVIAGVRTIVVLDQDLGAGGVAQEAELQMQAQDAHGAVWNLGEYPEVYDNGVLTGAPDTWIQGLSGAHGGIGMLAHPRLGVPKYLQGLVPKIQFEDCATVFATDQRVCVPAGCFTDVLVTDETSPLDPTSGHQRKYYAPGVGLIRADAVKDVTPEVLHLTRFTHLCPAALAKYRAEALTLDNRGYRVSPDVFGRTAHATRTLQAAHC